MSFRGKASAESDGKPNYNVPDMSKGDLFCANVSKAPGGLERTCETGRTDRNVAPFYNCYTCQDTYTEDTFIKHLLSLKHRSNYYRKVEPEKMQQVEALGLKDYQLEELLDRISFERFQDRGRGNIEVKVEKSHCQSIIKQEVCPDSGSTFSRRRSRNSSSSFIHFPPYPASRNVKREHYSPIRPMDSPPRSKIRRSPSVSSVVSRRCASPLPSATSVMGPPSPRAPASPSVVLNRLRNHLSESEYDSDLDEYLDLQQDIAHLGPVQHATIIDYMIEKAEEDGIDKCVNDPYMMGMIQECLKIKYAAFAKEIRKKKTKEQRKIIDFLFSEEGRLARSEFKRRALYVEGVSKYTI